MTTFVFPDLLDKEKTPDGFSVDVQRAFSFGTPGIKWSLRIERIRRSPKTGNRVKGEHIITLINNEGDGIPELLRDLANLLEHNEPMELPAR